MGDGGLPDQHGHAPHGAGPRRAGGGEQAGFLGIVYRVEHGGAAGQDAGIHRRRVAAGIHPHGGGVYQQVKIPGQTGQLHRLERRAGHEGQHVILQRAGGLKVLRAHGVDQPAAGQGGFAGEGAPYAAAAKQRHPAGEGHPPGLQRAEEPVGVGVVAHGAAFGHGDGVHRPVQLRPALQPIQQGDDRLLVRDGHVEALHLGKHLPQGGGQLLGRDVPGFVGGRPAGEGEQAAVDKGGHAVAQGMADDKI